MPINIEIPWAWYISRATALVSFLLLYVSIFLGAASVFPVLKKKFLVLGSLRAHCWISTQALLFALLHGLVLLFDKFIVFSVKGIFVPFAASYSPLLTGLGTISFYLMIILVSSSYLRGHISYGLWRALHYSNLLLYAIGTVHALFLGTDLRAGILRSVFIYANIFLIIFLLSSMFSKLKGHGREKIISVSQ
jgi:methionine sulfoxide reductase heme-binding subunit